MSTQRREFKKLEFTGGRFEETHGFLEFEVLQEFEAYRKILIETAKRVWRSKNPERTNLPAGFEKKFRLGLTAIGEGSCRVSVQRVDTLARR